MKAKTLVAMAALALLIGVPARGAEVISSNVVGYNKVTLTPGWNMLGSQFLNVGGMVQDVQDLTAKASLAGIDATTYEFHTELYVWNGGGYETYGWSDDDDGTDIDWDESNSKWLDLKQENIVSFPVANGTGFWVKTDAAGEIMFAGEVCSSNSVTQRTSVGFNMLSNPYPMALDVQKIQTVDLPGIDESSYEFHTELYVWNGGGYQTYGWSDADDGTDIDWEESNSKWLDLKQENIVDVTIPVGGGFWVKSDQSGTVTISK